ncbi:hypothetical protein BGX23_010663 [Mortierella sp. AD031]|nr:hypothetical protein BGX23_010663 [Mortierella sp. AD031]KAG0204620.1 hypothetical protein BGX33_008381 [Mortierella sp. NVP41]
MKRISTTLTWPKPKMTLAIIFTLLLIRFLSTTSATAAPVPNPSNTVMPMSRPTILPVPNPTMLPIPTTIPTSFPTLTAVPTIMPIPTCVPQNLNLGCTDDGMCEAVCELFGAVVDHCELLGNTCVCRYL